MKTRLAMTSALRGALTCMILLLLAPCAQAAERLAVGLTFLTSGLDPAEGSVGWALVSHGLGEKLFTVGRDGRVVGQLAESAQQMDDGSWRIRLRPDRFFSDGARVDAAATVTALQRTTERNAGARATIGRIAFATIDERTLRVTSERPTTVMPSVLAEWQFVIYKLAGDKPIFTGAWAVGDFRPGERLELIPNGHVAGERAPIVIRRFADAQSMALALRGGELDMAFNLPGESLGMLRAAPNLVVKSFPVAYQYLAWLNVRRGPLADLRVRQAVAMAIDRRSLATAIGAGEPTVSAFSREYPFASMDEAPPPDLARAAALLDESGWRRGADGARTKDGRRLSLSLWAYPQRADLVTMQPVLRAQLAALGIAAETRIAENANDLARRGEFDILLWAQHTAPAADPAFFLNLFLRTSAANNYSGWSSASFDATLDRLNRSADEQERIDLARAAQRIAREDAAAIFLLTPAWYVGLSQRLRDYEPWGSDYFIIRADMAGR